MSGQYYTGCAVWAFKDWVGDFYPPGSRAQDFLRLYCDRMTAVEGNTTFYSVPSAKTVSRWAEIMPADFRFCPKLPRAFSHQGPLYPHLPAALDFAARLAPLEQRLGPFLLQLPPSYSPAMAADLRQFLAAWPRQHWPLAVEVRHPAWFTARADHLNSMLQALGVGRVLLDTRPIYDPAAPRDIDPQLGSERKKPRVPLQPSLTAPFTLIRYIAHPEMARNYPYFREWQQRLAQWLRQGYQVYFFAHCPQEAYSPTVARDIYHHLQEAGAKLPPLKWDKVIAQTPEAENLPAQLSLF